MSKILFTIVTMYSFFGLEDNVLVLTTSYPKGNNLEEVKAQKLIQGLKIFLILKNENDFIVYGGGGSFANVYS